MLIVISLFLSVFLIEELAKKSIELAQTIPDKAKRNTCVASAFAFASKYLDGKKQNELLEVLKMTDLATMLINEREIEIAKNALLEGANIEFIRKITGLDESTIKQLQVELDNE